jgi:hypothetical protein
VQFKRVLASGATRGIGLPQDFENHAPFMAYDEIGNNTLGTKMTVSISVTLSVPPIFVKKLRALVQHAGRKRKREDGQEAQAQGPASDNAAEENKHDPAAPSRGKESQKKRKSPSGTSEDQLRFTALLGWQSSDDPPASTRASMAKEGSSAWASMRKGGAHCEK